MKVKSDTVSVCPEARKAFGNISTNLGTLRALWCRT